jgi:hypothetical protein
MSGCNMNDATVQVLANSCKLLKEVAIKGSSSCSDTSVDVLLQVFSPHAPADVLIHHHAPSDHAM